MRIEEVHGSVSESLLMNFQSRNRTNKNWSQQPIYQPKASQPKRNTTLNGRAVSIIGACY